MYSAGDIEAVATLDDSQYRKKLGGLSGAAKSVLGGVGRMLSGYLSLGAGVAAVKSAVSAHIVQEDAVNRVRAALRKQGEEYNLQTQDLEKYAAELQKVTTYGDETTLAAMAQGMNMGIASDRIKDATKAAMGLAAAYNMDLNTAMQLIAKANAGNTGALSRYGIVIDTSKSKQEQFNQVLQKGAEGFQLAEANAQTTGGRLKSLGNSWGDLQEQIGRFIVGLFEVRDASGNVTNALSEATVYIKENLDRWVHMIKLVYIEVDAAIQKVVALFIWMYDNWSNLWNNFPKIFTSLLWDMLQTFADFSQILIDLAVDLGAALWKAIKGEGMDAFSDVVDNAKKNFNKLTDNIGKNTAAAVKSVQKYGYGDLLDNINAKAEERKKELGEQYAERLARKNERQQDRVSKNAGVAEEGKRDTVGGFSAAILAGLLGAASPEAETAKNTKEMVQLQRRTLEKIGSDSGSGLKVG